MSLSVFSVKTSYYKNGLWWFTKIPARLIGEERWESMRLARRVFGNKLYYGRQQILFDIFYEWPAMANLIGIYPKVDTSHGILHWATYEAYRDWQEHTLNSDGSFAIWIYMFGGVYIAHCFYSYMIPYYWTNMFPAKNEEFVRLRMKDAIATTVLEELSFNNYAEFAWAPHDFHYNRQRCMAGYGHVDDPRTIHMASFNRKHKYKEHYLNRIGESSRMTTVL